MRAQAPRASALLAALFHCEPLVVAAAGREHTFRVKTGRYKPADAARVAQKLRLLGWDEADPFPLAPDPLPVVAPDQGAYLRARCRLCHESVELLVSNVGVSGPDPLHWEANAREFSRRMEKTSTAPSFHADWVESGPARECLGILDLLGVVFRRSPA